MPLFNCNINSSLAKQIEQGDNLPIDSFTTIQEKEIAVKSDTGLLYLHLARYSGCPVCNLHFRTVARRMPEMKERNIEVVFVMHSSQQVMLENQGSLEWAKELNFVADPEMKIYKQLGAMQSWLKVSQPTGLATAAAGFVDFHFKNHGAENGRNWVPLDILIDRATGKVVKVHQADAGIQDRWTVDTLLSFSQSNS